MRYNDRIERTPRKVKTPAAQPSDHEAGLAAVADAVQRQRTAENLQRAPEAPPPLTKPRRVVQIAALAPDRLYAVADDGSLWFTLPYADSPRWQLMLELPRAPKEVR